jgi:hypothetical protein
VSDTAATEDGGVSNRVLDMMATVETAGSVNGCLVGPANRC